MGLTRVEESLTAPYKEDKYYLNRLIEEYDISLKTIAARNDAIYVSIPVLHDSPRFLADGLHPTDEGHRVILRSFLEVFG
jgi:hypothetical protein